MCPPQEGEEYALTMKALTQWQHEVCPVLIHHYIAYPRSQSAGQTVAEFDPLSKAAMEIDQLYNYTLKQLNMIPHSDARKLSA